MTDSTAKPTACQDGPGSTPASVRDSGYRRYWSADHPRTVILLWLLVLAGATVGHNVMGSQYTDDFGLPSSPSQQGADLLQSHQPQAGGFGGQIVFTVDSDTVGADRTQIEAAVANVGKLAHVLSVSDPFSPATVSKDGKVAYATVHLDKNPAALGSDFVRTVDAATAVARDAAIRVDYGGTLGQAARPRAGDRTSEIIGITVAVVVLLVGFGSIYGAALPILAAIVGVLTGLGLLGTLAATITFASVSPTLATMLGLGVGIDYSLFVTTRHRQYVLDGMDPQEAVSRTVATSGRAVIVAAITVVIALGGLYASGIDFIGKLGLAAGITVAVAAIAALTLVPALLGLAGSRIDRLQVRRPIAEPADDKGMWPRYAQRLARHPGWYLVAGVLLLGVLAIPVLSMRLGHLDAGTDPRDYTSRRAYDAIGAGFGAGANGPLTVVATVPDKATITQLSTLKTALYEALVDTADVAAVAPVTTSKDGALLITTVVPRSNPQDDQTEALLNHLRESTLPHVLSVRGSKGYVTGITAAQLDFRDQVSSRLPVLILVVIAVAFLLLLATFRSVLVAVKAAILNLLSIGAAYGIVVAVFQWGWGGSWLGVEETVPIESYVPMMMFAIVFGLSMDYEVFLLTRVREAWLLTGDNRASVAHGLAATARVITCAALIMTSVFLAFVLSPNVVVKMLAIGMGVSVIIDATVIRLLVVPATMFFFGRANWWLPRWLDRALPRLEAERAR